MMKNKDKKQDDEGSAQSNPSRYDLYTFLKTIFTSVLIVYLVKHGWSPVNTFATWF